MCSVQDMLVVSELGQGINRGFMGLGRLYQVWNKFDKIWFIKCRGNLYYWYFQVKYIPPERKDIFSSDQTITEDNVENIPEELEEKNELPSNDIDLD